MTIQEKISQLEAAGVEVEYLESGTFQGGEEDCFTAGINPGDECRAVARNEWAGLLSALREAHKALEKIAGWPGPEGTNVGALITSEANALRRKLAVDALETIKAKIGAE